MKMRSLLFLLFFVTIAPLYAQKEAAIWYFGDHAGLDFNSGSPVTLTDGALTTNEGCATMSNKDGELLFYTDGSYVYNKNHQIMANGSNLWGNRSSTQSAVIVPKPRNPYIYYIFTVDEPNDLNTDDTTSNDRDPPNNGLNYSTVDMRLNNGLGDVVPPEKNIHLVTYNPNDSEEVKFKCSEKITAVQHDDGLSFWVVTHFINNFYSFKITTRGVDSNPVKTTTSLNIPLGGYLQNAVGYLKASPNGKKIAIVNTSSRSTNESGPRVQIVRNTGNVVLYNFDAATGKLTNGITVLNNANPYGVEFSSKTKKLYVTTNNFDSGGTALIESYLLQFDLLSSNIPASKTLIDNSTNVAGALQLAIDEKIYRAGYPLATLGGGYNKLSVINNPELDGTSSNYRQNAIDLNFKLSKQGLPPFITSLFLYSFAYEFNCLGDSTHFFINTVDTIDSVVWDFGDGTTSSNKDAFHVYANTGQYNVTLTKTVDGDTRDPIEKIITIYEAPVIAEVPYTLIQCDTQDTNPTDGLSTFNLELANNPISLGNASYDVFYYHSIGEAETDLNNLASIPTQYRNTIPDETIYAKVTQPSSSCYKIGTVILHANENNLLLPEPMNECDSGDGTAVFSLDIKKQSIKTELNLPSDVRLYFYSSERDALLGLNELDLKYTSASRTLYIRAENNEGCYGTGQFTIVVEPTPNINSYEERVICEGGAATIVLDSGIEAPAQSSEYSYLWSTGDKTTTITVSKPDEYWVEVKNNVGCTTIRTCKVTMSYLAKIRDIEIHDLVPSNYIKIDLENPENYKYKIVFQNGTSTAFQNSILFENISGGFHELILENLNGCGRISKTFSILEAPNFFTPNNDGFNDYWNLKGINTSLYNNALIFIYDRYGKLLKQLSPSSPGWDGNYNKSPLPTSDYWFTVKLEDGREAKGHFSLKR
jgi:gliding motility-associated-like protein